MTSAIIVKDNHPARDFVSITQVGLKAYDLGVANQASIEARLPGTLAALAKDLDTLGVVVPGATQARNEAVAATAAQNALVRQGYAQVRAIRQVVRKAGAPADVQRAYGVGRVTSPRRVRDVSAALQQIVDRAAAAPQEAAGFGLVAADVTTLRAFIAQLTTADAVQEKKRAGAPLSTKQRNVIGNRIVQTAAMIAGTGMRAFVSTPPVYASFEALMASTRRPRKGARGKGKTASPVEESGAAPTSEPAPSSGQG